jgi:hypothetical protein
LIYATDKDLLPGFEIIRNPSQGVYDGLYERMQRLYGWLHIPGDYSAMLRGMGDNKFAFFVLRNKGRFLIEISKMTIME